MEIYIYSYGIETEKPCDFTAKLNWISEVQFGLSYFRVGCTTVLFYEVLWYIAETKHRNVQSQTIHVHHLNVSFQT